MVLFAMHSFILDEGGFGFDHSFHKKSCLTLLLLLGFIYRDLDSIPFYSQI